MTEPIPAFFSFQSSVDETTAAVLLNVIAQQIEKGHKEIHLLISSPGGQTTNGIAVYNTLRAMPINLTTYNVGSVNSIANVIYLAGERRYACTGSSFMFHGVGVKVTEGSRLEEKNLVENLDHIRNDQGVIGQIISDRSNINPEEVANLFLRAAFMKSEEAKEYGIVHEIRNPDIPEGAPFFQLVFQPSDLLVSCQGRPCGADQVARPSPAPRPPP